MAATPQVNTTYCPPERAWGLRVSPMARFLRPHRVRFALRASEIRTSVRVILPQRGSDIEGLSPFSTCPRYPPIYKAGALSANITAPQGAISLIRQDESHFLRKEKISLPAPAGNLRKYSLAAIAALTFLIFRIMAATPQVNTTYCPPERAWGLRVSPSTPSQGEICPAGKRDSHICASDITPTG